MSNPIDKAQGILLNADIIIYEVPRTDPDYDITVVAQKYFELAESYTINKPN
jgi:hypothetical protein